MSKNIIILNGSPRLKGNTAMLCDAFMKGAESAGHAVTRFDLQKLDIHGCLGCMKGGKNPAAPACRKTVWKRYTLHTETPIWWCWLRPCITGAFRVS